MIDKRSLAGTKIFSEMSPEDIKNWFDFKQKKFLHNIDTLYYSVFLDGDFTKETDDKRVLDLRKFIQTEFDKIDAYEDVVFKPSFLAHEFLEYHTNFAGTYNWMLHLPDQYDIFIASKTANEKTAQMLVQIRSETLWIDGVNAAVEATLFDVKSIAAMFGFEIVSVQENRVDYAWHTNYFKDPASFLRLDKIAAMRVGTLNEGFQHYKFHGDNDYEIDYFTLGKKQSNNIFFRIYLKSKEIIQASSHKYWFYKLWFLHGLINRYDLYVYEQMALAGSWSYMHKARLLWYIEYGADESIKKLLKNVVYDRPSRRAYDYIKDLADSLTPPVNLVVNVEYETKRKFYASCVLPNDKELSEKRGVYQRLFAVIKYRRFITNYLTESVVRFVEPDDEDSNKARRPIIPFWKALTGCKIVDDKYGKRKGKIIRRYHHELSSECVKRRAINAMVTHNLYKKGKHEDRPSDEVIDFMNCLNDNDIAHFIDQREKQQLRIRLDEDVEYEGIKREKYGLFLKPEDAEDDEEYILVRSSGEIIFGQDVRS